ncbi:hypothetical protein ACFSTC_25340 [Nonomuraea ferruginea]
MKGLHWEADGQPRGLTPDPLAVRSGQTAVLVAHDAEEADLVADFLLGLSWGHDGVITIGGEQVTQATWEREIGLVPAGAGLLPHLTVEKNLVLTSFGERASARVQGRVAYMARRTQIEGFLHARPHELAHDERLAVALTRVLSPAPPGQGGGDRGPYRVRAVPRGGERRAERRPRAGGAGDHRRPHPRGEPRASHAVLGCHRLGRDRRGGGGCSAVDGSSRRSPPPGWPPGAPGPGRCGSRWCGAATSYAGSSPWRATTRTGRSPSTRRATTSPPCCAGRRRRSRRTWPSSPPARHAVRAGDPGRDQAPGGPAAPAGVLAAAGVAGAGPGARRLVQDRAQVAGLAPRRPRSPASRDARRVDAAPGHAVDRRGRRVDAQRLVRERAAGPQPRHVPRARLPGGAVGGPPRWRRRWSCWRPSGRPA